MARATDKVPDWLLERLSAGELAHAQATELRQRLRAQGEEYRLSALSASDAEILSALPPGRIVPEIERRVLCPPIVPDRPDPTACGPCWPCPRSRRAPPAWP